MITGRTSSIACALLMAALCCAVEPAVDAAEPVSDLHRISNALPDAIVCTDGRLTINVDNIDIAQLLRMLSVKRRVSIVAGPQVTGEISLNLYDVTFEEALRAILDVSGCTATYKGDVILVTGALEKGQLPLDTADMHIRVFKLDYLDPSEAFTMVQQFTSPAGKAVVSNIESTLLVEDTAAYLDRISSLVEQMDVAPKQVLIEATLLEIASDDSLTLGVELGVTKVNGNTIFRALTSGFAADVTALPETAQGMFAGILTEDTETFIEALAEVGNVKTLANPKILAVDRQQAEIIIGDKLGYRITTTTQTSSLESVAFLSVGTQLTLTPRISDDGIVMLEIHPEVSDGSISSLGLPSESTAEATTYMLVKDGQTIVLGGLIQERTSDQVAKVPLLGDIPLLGHLFRRTTKSKTVSELVVLITPHIMGPQPDKAMRETINNVAEMSGGRERLLYGKRERPVETVRTPPFSPRGSSSAQIEEPSGVTPEPGPAYPEEAAPPLAEAAKDDIADDYFAELMMDENFSALDEELVSQAHEPPPSQPEEEAAPADRQDKAPSLAQAYIEERPDAPAHEYQAETPAESDRVEHAESFSSIITTVARDVAEVTVLRPANMALLMAAAPEPEQCRYSVQVFAARNEKITSDYVRKLQQDGLNAAWTKPPDVNAGDEWYRAMIGRFDTRAEAKATLKDLQQRREFEDAFIRGRQEGVARRGDERVMHARANPEQGQD
jgi:type IV pilus secretin PilQ/predicted competence protein